MIRVSVGPQTDPRLVCVAQGKRDGSTRDEAFAWESREFLRKKLIGQVGWDNECAALRSAVPHQLLTPPSALLLVLQPCVFKVDYVVEVAGNKEFGSVFLQQGGQQENVALSVVQNGWAKVRAGCITGRTRSLLVQPDRAITQSHTTADAATPARVQLHSVSHSTHPGTWCQAVNKLPAAGVSLVCRCVRPLAPTPSRAPSMRSC